MTRLKKTDLKKNILILSVSAGAGHIRAAQALAKTATDRFKFYNTTHLDIMELVPRIFRKIYCDSYLSIIKNHPFFWGYLYEKTDHLSQKSAIDKFRIMIEELNTIKIRKMIKNRVPNVIICTHFLPAQILSMMIARGELDIPVWVQVTDFDIHSLWIHPHMEGYFAASEEVAFRMSTKGVIFNRIHVTGIPVMPCFSCKVPRVEAATIVGIDPLKKTFLLMSGGAGVNEIDRIVKSLLGIKDSFQIIALAGKNQKLLKRLMILSKKFPDKVFPVGFVNDIENYMAVSDLAITKPGGLTTAECLAMNLPMLIISPIPGQEERNADFLLEHGAAMKAHDLAGIEYKIREILKNASLLNKMSKAANKISNPYAALNVLEIVLKNIKKA